MQIDFTNFPMNKYLVWLVPPILLPNTSYSKDLLACFQYGISKFCVHVFMQALG